MTPLRKPVRRLTRHRYHVLYVHEARAIVVCLEPGDVVSFREAGRRQKWSLPIDRMFRQAVRESVAAAKSSSSRR